MTTWKLLNFARLPSLHYWKGAQNHQKTHGITTHKSIKYTVQSMVALLFS